MGKWDDCEAYISIEVNINHARVDKLFHRLTKTMLYVMEQK